MITSLSGTITHVGALFCIVEVSGVGYKVYAHPRTLFTLAEGQQTLLWVHHAVREDAENLFGFLSHAELSFFELLITVSGVGPRSALSILSLLEPAPLAHAIHSGDASSLTRVSGIGKKIAEKLVLELKDKVAPFVDHSQAHDDTDVLEALISMGYTHAHAREAVHTLPDTLVSVPERLKAALAYKK